MNPKFSIITTCKGRLANLRRTLPQFLRQRDAEVIVVDYDCPEGTSSYVAGQYPEVRLVGVKNKPTFNAPHARNLGAAQARGEFLIFLDADIIVSDDFAGSAEAVMRPGTFAVFGPPAKDSLRGQSVIRKTHFTSVGGFDDMLDGYGGEELELYMRLRLAGLRAVALDQGSVIEVIDQTVQERERFRAPDLRKQFLRGQMYSSAKELVMRAMGRINLPREDRQRILAQIDARLPELYAGTADFRLEVDIPDRHTKRRWLRDWEFSRSVTLRVSRRRQGN
jgi:hypothetical protein